MESILYPDEMTVGYKTRRSHRKSRYGCKKCKDRRIKCDELKPKCSRCSTLGLSCNYPIKLISSSSSPSIPLQIRGVHAFLQSEAIKRLTSQEYTLFKHYMEHTSRDLTVDDQEQYTLQIRIPILAFQCTPLLRSILALSAVCKCSDTIKNSPEMEDHDKILELLSTADQYHMDSLHEIQDRLPRTKQYDHILANAAMMGMYGSGSHCIRIWLTESTTLNEQTRKDVRPKSSQWIRLFRAVHMAYTGLLKNAGPRDEISEQYFTGELPNSILEDSPVAWFPQRQPSQFKQPRNPSEHALYPILSATVSSALTILERKVHAVTQPTEIHLLEDTREPGIRACHDALEIFKEILYETFPAQFPRTEQPFTRINSNFDNDYDRIARSLNISPWLHQYTASITSMVPSGLPRRFIMAFVHKVPIEYLTLVEEVVGLTCLHADSADSDALALFLSENGAVHRVALEIFSHWLVLVMLLSDVWWIGDTGIWELKNIVSFRQSLRTDIDTEDWWPKSMSEVSQQLKRYAS